MYCNVNEHNILTVHKVHQKNCGAFMFRPEPDYMSQTTLHWSLNRSIERCPLHNPVRLRSPENVFHSSSSSSGTGSGYCVPFHLHSAYTCHRITKTFVGRKGETTKMAVFIVYFSAPRHQQWTQRVLAQPTDTKTSNSVHGTSAYALCLHAYSIQHTPNE